MDDGEEQARTASESVEKHDDPLKRIHPPSSQDDSSDIQETDHKRRKQDNTNSESCPEPTGQPPLTGVTRESDILPGENVEFTTPDNSSTEQSKSSANDTKCPEEEIVSSCPVSVEECGEKDSGPGETSSLEAASQEALNLSTGFDAASSSETDISDRAKLTHTVAVGSTAEDTDIHSSKQVQECVKESEEVKDAVSVTNISAENPDSGTSSKTSLKSSSYEVSDKTLLNLPMRSCGSGISGAVDAQFADGVSTERYESDFLRNPTQISGAWTEFSHPSNFLKGCKWSPDGSMILTNSEDKALRVFHQKPELLCGGHENKDEMVSSVQLQEGELIYDYSWLPLMNISESSSCCVVSTCRDTPVHMWDVTTAKIRCSYRSYDQMDEIVAAHSVAFSPDGRKLYCGFNKMIRVFDTARPGRQFKKRQTYVKQGQSGIISCIAVNPMEPSMYAAGSYSRAVAIYNEPDGSMMCMFEGQVGGVTHIMFSPDGNRLYSGGRKDPEILCWDVRNPGKLLYTMQRSVLTNQRMYFDIDKSSQYLLSGNHDGSISVWDTLATAAEEGDGEPMLHPVTTFQAHQDACNGVSLHPTLPVLATASGQRKFKTSLQDGSSDEEDEQNAVDNSLRLWWMGKT